MLAANKKVHTAHNKVHKANSKMLSSHRGNLTERKNAKFGMFVMLRLPFSLHSLSLLLKGQQPDLSSWNLYIDEDYWTSWSSQRYYERAAIIFSPKPYFLHTIKCIQAMQAWSITSLCFGMQCSRGSATTVSESCQSSDSPASRLAI